MQQLQHLGSTQTQTARDSFVQEVISKSHLPQRGNQIVQHQLKMYGRQSPYKETRAKYVSRFLFLKAGHPTLRR